MSETGGTVNAMYVGEGDIVGKGDKLFSLDASTLECQLEEAQLQYDALVDAQAQTVMAQNGSLSDAERSLMEQKIKVALALSQTTGYDFDSFNETFAGTAEDAAAAMASSLSGLTLDDLTSAVPADIGSDSQLAWRSLRSKAFSPLLIKCRLPA